VNFPLLVQRASAHTLPPAEFNQCEILTDDFAPVDDLLRR